MSDSAPPLPSSLEHVLCSTIGCTSIFARWWQWPHRLICTPLATRGMPVAPPKPPSSAPEVER